VSGCFPTYCRCCECQGKRCLVGHPGHSHRYAGGAEDPLARLAEILRQTNQRRQARRAESDEDEQC
jgi:hypothetical protein